MILWFVAAASVGGSSGTGGAAASARWPRVGGLAAAGRRHLIKLIY